MTDRSSLEQLTEQIIGSAIAVHNTLGPGLLESIYHRCLVVELRARRLRVETERPVHVVYRDVPIESPSKLTS
jgi:GxxExxY protein